MTDLWQGIASVPWWGWALVVVASAVGTICDGIAEENRRKMRLMTGRWDL